MVAMGSVILDWICLIFFFFFDGHCHPSYDVFGGVVGVSCRNEGRGQDSW